MHSAVYQLVYWANEFQRGYHSRTDEENAEYLVTDLGPKLDAVLNLDLPEDQQQIVTQAWLGISAIAISLAPSVNKKTKSPVTDGLRTLLGLKKPTRTSRA